MPHRYDTDYEIGQDNIRTWCMPLHMGLKHEQRFALGGRARADETRKA